MKLLKTTLVGSVILSLLSASANADNAMKSIFSGMVNTTSPATMESATRWGATGGSFSYRTPTVNTNLVNVSFPKASVGCSGVDIFLGSFSLINGDQLVQIGRGIAQGAAAYAFNIAISAICADCAATLNDLQNKLQGLNKFAKDSCQATYSFLSNNVGTPEQFANSVSSGPGAALSAINGLVPDFGKAMSQDPATTNKANYARNPDEFKEKFAGNLTYMGFMNVDGGSLNIAGNSDLSGVKLAESIISLSGTVIVSWDDKGENSNFNYVTGNLSVEGFIYGPKNGSTVKFLRCSPTPQGVNKGKNECLEMKESTESFQGVSKTIRDLLISAQSKLLANKALADDELRIINMLGLDIVHSLETLPQRDGAVYIDQISDVAASQFVISTFTSVIQRLKNMQPSAEALNAFKGQSDRIIDGLYQQMKQTKDLQITRTGGSVNDLIRFWKDDVEKAQVQRDSGMYD